MRPISSPTETLSRRLSVGTGTRGRRAALFSKLRGSIMRYRVYSGPRGSADVSPLEKEQLLFKEFTTLDDALGWAHHVEDGGRVPLLIEGDDGTKMNKRAIGEALRVRSAEEVGEHSRHRMEETGRDGH